MYLATSISYNPFFQTSQHNVLLYIRLSERQVILRNLLHPLSSRPASKGPFYIFIPSFSTTNTTAVFYFNLTPRAAWYSALGASTPPPPSKQPSSSVQSASSNTDGRTDTSPFQKDPQKIHKKPQFVPIVHDYTLFTNLQCSNLYTDAVTAMFIATTTKPILSANSTQSAFSHHNVKAKFALERAMKD
jgi:hypothetical protein